VLGWGWDGTSWSSWRWRDPVVGMLRPGKGRVGSWGGFSLWTLYGAEGYEYG
jgi:hypothetical protein